MPNRIEDYALIGDCQTAALVGRDGSIDWLCLPRFDSGACFAAMLGTRQNGHWQIAPAHPEQVRGVSRRYRGDTLVLETEYRTDTGTVAVIDFMPPRDKAPDLVRIVEGRAGTVPLRLDLAIRFDYGSVVPWVRHVNHGITAIGGPDMLRLDSPVETRGEDYSTVADFTVSEGQRLPFVLVWHPSHQPEPAPVDPLAELEATEAWWTDWASRCTYQGPYREAVVRSLITLKAMTYAPTGGIVAAPTTSLPEHIGGIRNWDYRYCWIRDATFTLIALMEAGYVEEARAWRDWLLRAAAGNPAKLQIMYGLSGERRLTEMELPWLDGYEGSKPVRIGNGAWCQHQLDVYGEAMDALYQARRGAIEARQGEWRLERALIEFLESDWRNPDYGLWEIRGPKQHFTHSKMMAWVAFDRAVRFVERFGLDGPCDRWRSIRDEIHHEVCTRGFDPTIHSFVQFYGTTLLDASLLMMGEVGFLPYKDPRVVGTVEAIERELTIDGAFVRRYDCAEGVDGLPPGEGAFLLCSFWLVDNLAMIGRKDDARRIFDRLLAIRNDVGLLAEEYDPLACRQLGNFPQAFSHIGLINSATNLTVEYGPAERRIER